MSPSQYRLSVLLVMAVFLLSACNLPGRGVPTQSEADLIYTAAAQTVQAQLTQVSKPPATQLGETPFPSNTTPVPGEPSSTPLPQETAVSGGTATATSIPCDQAKFVKDVTIPDNTEFSPGKTFVKTWRLQNTGSCTWTSEYSIVFAGGDAMGAPASVQLTTGSVAPGDTVDVSVSLEAPNTSGTYRGDWKLRNAAGQVFGVGTDGSKPFWVQIDVVVATGIVYDFLVRASSADWVSGVGDSPGTDLAFGGNQDDPQGVARIVDDVKLETGATSSKVLLTVPQHEKDGFVSGTFSEYTVQPGDHFKARLGFMTPGGSCDAGRVKFLLKYKEGDKLQTFKTWTKSCNGSLLRVDVDLSSLKGKAVRFVFEVSADGAFNNDWAIWNSPLIEH